MVCGQSIDGPFAGALINRCERCSHRDGSLSVEAWTRVLAHADRSGAYARELDQRSAKAKAIDPGAGFPPLLTSVRPPEMSEHAWFLRVLTENFIPTTDRAITQWKALAKRYGKATTYTEAAACVEWCLTAAAMKGTRIAYAEHAVTYAQRWALMRTAGSSTASSTPTPALPCPATPPIGSPTIATSTTSTPLPAPSTVDSGTPSF